VLWYVKEKHEMDAEFFYRFETDDEVYLTRLFWADRSQDLTANLLVIY